MNPFLVDHHEEHPVKPPGRPNVFPLSPRVILVVVIYLALLLDNILLTVIGEWSDD